MWCYLHRQCKEIEYQIINVSITQGKIQISLSEGRGGEKTDGRSKYAFYYSCAVQEKSKSFILLYVPVINYIYGQAVKIAFCLFSYCWYRPLYSVAHRIIWHNRIIHLGLSFSRWISFKLYDGGLHTCQRQVSADYTVIYHPRELRSRLCMNQRYRSPLVNFSHRHCF